MSSEFPTYATILIFVRSSAIRGLQLKLKFREHTVRAYWLHARTNILSSHGFDILTPV